MHNYLNWHSARILQRKILRLFKIPCISGFNYYSKLTLPAETGNNPRWRAAKITLTFYYLKSTWNKQLFSNENTPHSS